MDTPTLGQKIKFFRKRAELSQLELETAISAAPGSVSRIESGKVNPTKETLDQISTKLDLNQNEISYLYGILSKPVTDAEIAKAIQEIAEYFSRPDVFGYLVDDRWRTFAASKGLLDFVGMTQEESQQYFGYFLLQFLFDSNGRFFELFARDKIEDMVAFQLSRLFSDTDYLKLEPWTKDFLGLSKQHPIFASALAKLEKDPKRYIEKESRMIYFSKGGKEIPMTYSRETLQNNPRFVVIEYFPIKHE